MNPVPPTREALIITMRAAPGIASIETLADALLAADFWAARSGHSEGCADFYVEYGVPEGGYCHVCGEIVPELAAPSVPVVDREALAKHQLVSHGMSSGSPDTCSCGAETFPDETDEPIDIRRNRAFAGHQSDVLGLHDAADVWDECVAAAEDAVGHAVIFENPYRSASPKGSGS